MSDLNLGILTFVQLGVILVVCRLVGWLGSKFLGQTQVVGEMLAGVLLGPSVLGAVRPQFSAWLFPATLGGVRHPSMQILYVMSQVGLGLYMFCVGMQFDLKLLQSRAKAAAMVSAAGIAFPFLLGVGLALMIHGDTRYFAAGLSVSAAALYLGSAMCITAFPMLARIISEKGLSKTTMGTLALAAGSMDDVFAWILLALVLAMAKGNVMIGILAIGGGLLFAAAMMTLGRRFFTFIQSRMGEELDMTTLVTVLSVLMLSCAFTDGIGIYAVFGAFITGAAIPKGRLAYGLKLRIEPLTVGLLLPLFFIFSGLNTKIQLLGDPHLFGFAILALVAAMVGKGGACMLAAKLSGEPWRESVAIGTLMNARGLMELIILNIGLQQGIIKPALFTTMVLMAIITTLIASPLFARVYGHQRPEGESPAGTIGSVSAP